MNNNATLIDSMEGRRANVRTVSAANVNALKDFVLTGISDGAFESDGRIPPERELSTRFGIPRYAVRKALRDLADRGRISRSVGRGTYVISLPTASEVSAQGEPRRHFSPAEIVQARLALEPALADLAVINATRDDFIEMDRCLQSAARAETEQEFKVLIYSLHYAIAKATKNALLARLFEMIIEARKAEGWDSVPGCLSSTAAGRAKYLKENQEIVDALKTRSAPRSRKLLHTHLLKIFSGLVGASNA